MSYSASTGVGSAKFLQGRLGGFCRSPALALALATLFWSGNFIAGRALRGEIDPLTLNFCRWLAALLLFLPFVGRDMAVNAKVVLREWRLVLGLAVTGIAGFHTLVYLALRTTTATNALLTLSLSPMAILLGAGLAGMERLKTRQWIGVLLSTAGAAVLVTRGRLWAIQATDLRAGDLWMLAGVVLWAAYSLLLRRRPADLPQGVALAASIFAALALMAPVLIVAHGTNLSALAAAPVLASIGYIALFASVLGFLLWSRGVSMLGPSRAGQFIHLMPVFGAALAAILLDEAPTAPQFIGAALVLSGIAVVERSDRAHRC